LKQANKVVTAIEDLGIEKNRETFEILVSYYTNAGRLEDTWSIINKMRRQGFKPNSYVYSKIIELYRDNGMWKKAVEILREIKDEGIPLDKKIYNSIIDTFGKHGDLEGALEVFDEMPIKLDIKYSEVEKAVELFSRMQEQGGMYPDPKIFIKLINSLGEQGIM
jgi:pentatricopeptide repeat protein